MTPPPTPSLLPEPPNSYTWEPIQALSDEFDGNKLDTSKWLDHHPYWSGRTPSQHVPANVSVGDGYLQLKNTTKVKSLVEVADPKEENWVEAACVTSVQPNAGYGYYEARMKASDISMTSSFWFQGEYSEIDVVEQLGAPKLNPSRRKLMLINTHYYPDGWEHDRKTPRDIPIEPGASDDFHVYGVWWKDADTAWFYHNGELVTEVEFGGKFNEPMYLFFDTEVFTWEGLPSVDTLQDESKNTVLVDWVRAWRLVEK